METSSAFDQELTLAELLPEKERGPLLALVSGVAGLRVRLALLDAEPSPGWSRVEVKWNLEPVAWLEGQGEVERLQAVVPLLQHLLSKNAIYRMVSTLHLETVHADYAALQEEHAALLVSEARYRELNAQLEEKVREQVAALRQTERALFEEERLASVGRLAAGVAHEINNPLTFILVNLATAGEYVKQLQQFRTVWQQQGAGAAQTQWEESDLDYSLNDFDALLRESLNGVHRAAAIVKDLRLFSGVDGEDLREESLESLLKVVVRLLAAEKPAKVVLVEEYHGLPPYPCHPAAMGQVFQNLLRNAFQAVPEGGQVTLRTARTPEALCLEVQDNGCGIPPEHLGRIFDPFFTTREVGQGSGLGLTVCRDVVRKLGGQIQVSSQPGAGSVFKITLPLRPL